MGPRLSPGSIEAKRRPHPLPGRSATGDFRRRIGRVGVRNRGASRAGVIALASVLSIQSAVAYGHVGNSAALFAMQRLGCDVWPVDTVSFSNHPAHGGWRGATTDAGRLGELVAGLEERGFLAGCDAVLSGYLGSAANGGVVRDAVARVRRANRTALYCCDPVMGDRPHGLYVADDLPAVFREVLVPAADIATPNPFELESLTGIAVRDTASALAAARALLLRGPSLVLATGLPAGGDVRVLAVTAEAAWIAGAPRIETPVYGTGDAFTAIFLARWLEKGDVPRALSLAVSAIHAVLRITEDAGGHELALIAAQDAIPSPPRIFRAERVS